VKLLLLPFELLWRLVALVVQLTGRLVAVAIGLVFVLVGGLISLTIVGAIVGVPLIALGFMLIARGLF
jgi:hypothetical protein